MTRFALFSQSRVVYSLRSILIIGRLVFMIVWNRKVDMKPTGVDETRWDSITMGVSSSTTNIGCIKDLTFKKTDLTPFTTFNEVLEHFNKSIVKLKDFTRADASKMEQAAKNKVQDDAQEAGAIQAGGMIR